MVLAKRLAAMVEYIPSGSIVADIGTDHAYLPIFLVETGKCPQVIATELNLGPYRSAGRMVKEFKLSDKIDLRLGDGLRVLKPGEVDVLVLAGMGGNTIREILSTAPAVFDTVKKLVLQPMADPGGLRIWLAAGGWKITDEKLVEDDGRIYIVIVAEPGREDTKDLFLLELGPRLLEKKDPLLKPYLNKIANRIERVLDGLTIAKSDAVLKKKIELKEKLARIREMVDCL